jgi:hypothetical protein
MNRHWIIYLLLAVTATLSASTAQAHRPYAVKVKTIQSLKHDILIVERLFGDGIFFADPVRLQIRNQQDAVIAHSQTASHVGAFCPSIQFCWAFPYQGLLVEPMYLDYKKLDYHRSNGLKTPEELTNYLSGSSTTLRTPSLVYPSSRDMPENFIAASSLLKLLSPLIIIGDNFLTFLLLAILYFLPSFLLPIYITFSQRQNGLRRTSFLLLGLIVFITYIALSLLASFVILFTWSMPIIYCLLIAGASVWVGITLSRRFTSSGAPHIQHTQSEKP